MKKTPQDNKIKDYLVSRVDEEITSLEVTGTDSVLSLAPLSFMYNDCLRAMSDDNKLKDACNTMDKYLQEVSECWDKVRIGTPWLKEGHEYDWRKIDKVRVNGMVDIEVIYDVDGSIMMTGREYNEEMMDWLHKLLECERK